MLAHDVLFGGLGIFETDHMVLLLALETANPVLPASLRWLCTKFQTLGNIVWAVRCDRLGESGH